MKKMICAVLVLASLCLADFRFDTIKEYDAAIDVLEKQAKELKAEREKFERKAEKTTMISVWALWKAGEELEYIHPTREAYDNIEEGIIYFMTTSPVCPQNFKKWIHRARELDSD